MTLRVLSVLTTDAAGGAEYAAVDLLQALEARGHHTRLLTNRPELAAGTAVDASRIDLGPKLGRRTAAELALRAPGLRRRLAAALAAEFRSRPFDVLLLHFKKEQFLAASLPRQTTRAVVWAEWGPLPGPLRGGLGRRVYRTAARRANAILVESKSTAEGLQAAGVEGGRLVEIGNVFDGERLSASDHEVREVRREAGVEAGDFLVGCVSRLDASKRLETVVEATAAVPGAVLLLAGAGEQEAGLRQLARARGARLYLMPSARGRIAAVLAACDLVVYSPSATEGAPRGITLPQLLARPVIATARSGAEHLLLPGTGTTVAPDYDVAALADCLRRYRDDLPRREREGAAGRAAALARLRTLDPVAAAERALRAAAAR